jgi:predicted Zn-dependent protease
MLRIDARGVTVARGDLVYQSGRVETWREITAAGIVLPKQILVTQATRDAAGAEAMLRRAVAQPTATLQMRLNLAMVLGLTGQMDEAEQILRRDLPPDAADRNMAWLQARTGPGAGTGNEQARTWNSLQGG